MLFSHVLHLLSPFSSRRRVLGFDEICTLQAIAGQTVLSLNSIPNLMEEEKEKLAEEQAAMLLEEIGLDVPDKLIRIAILAARFSIERGQLSSPILEKA